MSRRMIDQISVTHVPAAIAQRAIHIRDIFPTAEEILFE